jgi:hypothetical protein
MKDQQPRTQIVTVAAFDYCDIQTPTVVAMRDKQSSGKYCGRFKNIRSLASFSYSIRIN